MLATSYTTIVTPGDLQRSHTVPGPWCYRKSYRASADLLSFQCTQHVGSIMPWVLAWATWHHSVQPLSNSSFSSNIQGNKNRITWGGGGTGKSLPPAEHTGKLSWYALIWPPTSCDPCIPCVSSVLQDKPTPPSLSHAALMSARGHEVND